MLQHGLPESLLGANDPRSDPPNSRIQPATNGRQDVVHERPVQGVKSRPIVERDLQHRSCPRLRNVRSTWHRRVHHLVKETMPRALVGEVPEEIGERKGLLGRQHHKTEVLGVVQPQPAQHGVQGPNGIVALRHEVKIVPLIVLRLLQHLQLQFHHPWPPGEHVHLGELPERAARYRGQGGGAPVQVDPDQRVRGSAEPAQQAHDSGARRLGMHEH
mmetsp:Transcript_69964/g.160818  ORF Transcript_69964/g.160818 Transcript_69964/m.160818 type:complete len:216 (+) Transcript_69964:367-1014(+)